VPLGTAAAPSIAIEGDENTGIYSPGADQLAISTGGTGRLFVDASGRVSTGSAVASSYYANNFVISTAAEGGLTFANNSTSGANYIAFADGTTGNERFRGYIYYDHTADAFVTATAGTERMRLDSSGRLGLGTSSPVAFLHVSGSGASSCRLTDTQSYNFGTSGPTLDLTGNDSSGANTLFARLKGSPNNGNPDRGFLDILTRVDGITTSTLQVGTGLAANVLIPNGRVGIGTSAPDTILHTAVSQAGSAAVNIFKAQATNTTNNVITRLDLSAEPALGTASVLRFSAITGNAADSSNMAFNIRNAGASTEVLRISSLGRVGIGTTSPAVQLSVVSSGAAGSTISAFDATASRAYFQAGGTSGNQYLQMGADTSGTFINDFQSSSTGLKFQINSTERARIDSSGRLLVGTSTRLLTDARNRLSVDSGSGTFVTGSFKNDAGSNAQVIETWNASTSGDAKFISFLTETSVVERGLIDYNRAAGLVRYNVTSDRRLKSAIQPAASAVDLLSSIQVRSYIWTETGYTVNYGFVAQELNEVLPDAVKAGDDSEEVQDTWAVDNSKLVPLLTKALQEAIAKIETLEARLTAAGIE
jgi:hypothetical protein